MKYYLYSTEPSFEFEEEVASFEFSDIESKSIVDDFIHDEILSLPISPVMTDDEVERVVEVVNGF